MIAEPFIKAESIFKQLNDHGYECYFVGGSVRDYIMNKAIGDIDIATDAPPHIVQKLFQRTVPIGIEHGTILVLVGDESFEVTTYRTEGDYKDHRHPDQVEFVKDIREDLSRRDFTINAMAMNLRGETLDPFGGLQDIEKRRIQTVRSPFDRFNEDALRMLRAIRFSSQLNFLIDEDVLVAIEQNRKLLNDISVERIAIEVSKMFNGNGIQKALRYLKETKLFDELPVFNENPPVFEMVCDQLKTSISKQSVWVAYLHYLDESIPISSWVRAYKLANVVKTQARKITDGYSQFKDAGITANLLYQLTDEHIPSFLEFIRITTGQKYEEEEIFASYEKLPIKRLSDLQVSGSDLVQWFPEANKGKWIGDYLEKLGSKVIAGKLPNQYEALKEEVKTWGQTGQS